MITEIASAINTTFLWVIYLVGVYTSVSFIAKNFNILKVPPVPVSEPEPLSMPVPVSPPVPVYLPEPAPVPVLNKQGDELGSLNRMMRALSLDGVEEEKLWWDFSAMRRCSSAEPTSGYVFAPWEVTKQNLYITAEELYETMRYPEGSPEAPGHQEEVVQVEEQTEGVYDWIKRRAQKFAQ